jgi:hypothetical protein
MGLASRFVLLIIIPITILIGFTITFSLISGEQKPFDLFNKVEILTNNYLLIGALILVGIVFFGFLLSLKEKLLGSS